MPDSCRPSAQGPLNLPPALNSEMELKRDLVTKAAQERELRGQPVVPGCRRVAAPCSCRCGRDRGADRVRHQRLGIVPVGPRAQSGLVRVQQPAWRIAEHGCGAVAGLFLGLCHRARHPHAARITGRKRVLVPAFSDPERLSVIRTYCQPTDMASHIAVDLVAADPPRGGSALPTCGRSSGRMWPRCISRTRLSGHAGNRSGRDCRDGAGGGGRNHRRRRSDQPGRGDGAGGLWRGHRGGADAAPGRAHALRGGVAVTSRRGTRNAMCGSSTGFWCPSPRRANRAVRFGLACAHQNSYGMRENGKDWTGNSTYLWAIAGAVYMSLLGPEGFREVGTLIVSRARYAAACWRRCRGCGCRSATASRSSCELRRHRQDSGADQ